MTSGLLTRPPTLFDTLGVHELRADEARADAAGAHEAHTDAAGAHEAHTDAAGAHEAHTDAARAHEARTDAARAREARTDAARAREARTDAARAHEAHVGGVGGEPTLDALVVGLWEGLAAHHSVACPVCAGELEPVYSAHALPVAGRCRGCGTTLS